MLTLPPVTAPVLVGRVVELISRELEAFISPGYASICGLDLRQSAIWVVYSRRWSASRKGLLTESRGRVQG